MSFGLSSGGGQVRYAIIVTDQATQPINTIKNSFNQLAATSSTTSGKMAIMNNTFSASVSPIKNTGDAMNQLVNTHKTLGQQLGGIASGFKNNALAIGAAASSVLGLYQNYANLSSAQNAANKSATAAKAAQNSVTTATKALNKAIDQYGSNSKEAKAAQDKLTVAQERAVNRAESAKIAQDNLNQTTADFGINILPNVILAGGSIVSIFDNIDLKGKSLTGMVSKLGGTFSGLGTVISGAITSLITGGKGLDGFKEKLTSAGLSAGSLKGNLLGLGVTTTVIGGITFAALQLADGMNQVIKPFSAIEKPVSALETSVDKTGKSLDIFNQTLAETDAMTTAGVTPAIVALDYVMKTHMTETLLKNAGYIDENSKQTQLFKDKIAEMNKKLIESGQIIPPVGKAVNDLGEGFKNSSADFTMWATNMLNSGKTSQQVATWLHDSNIKEADALKILDAAMTAHVKTLGQVNDLQKIVASHNLFDIWERQAGQAVAVTAGFGDTIENLKKKFLELAAAQKDLFGTNLSQGVLQYKELLKTWGGGKITQTVEQTNQKLKEHAGLVAQTNTGVKTLWQTWEKDAAGEVLKMDAKAIEDARKKLEAFNKKIAEGVQAVGVTFKVKDNVEKFMKEIKKNLPDKIEKKIDMKLDFRGNVKDATTAFNSFLETATTMDEKTADGIVKGIIKTIDEQFKGKKGAFAGLRAQLETEMKNPNTVQILKNNIANGDYTAAGKGVFSSVQAGIVAAANAGGGLASLWENSTGKGKGIVIPAPVIPKPITTAFDNGVKTLTTNVANISKTVPDISINTKPANSALSALIKRIGSIGNMKPAPQLNTKPANNALSSLIKRIDSISNMKPAFKLNTGPANSVLSTLIRRIDSISNMHPTVTVKVNYDTSAKPAGVKADSSASKFDLAGSTMSVASSKTNSGTGDIIIENHNHIMDQDIVRRFKAQQGTGRYRFGLG